MANIVYRFKKKVFNGEWGFVVDKDKIPVTITTSKNRGVALRMFMRKYPSMAQTYRPGETLVAEPDYDATKAMEDYQKRKQEEREEQIQSAWWNN